MRKIIRIAVLFSVLMVISCTTDQTFVLENDTVSRTITIEGNQLFTTQIENKIAHKKLIPATSQEFKLRISKGTHTQGTDIELTSKDFDFVKIIKEEEGELGFLLTNKTHGLDVEVHYELEPGDFYIRKYLKIKSSTPIALERIDIEVFSLEDIYQPYQIKQITAQGVAKWRPGLGQPLYTSKSAVFLGVEFPAADNFVNNGIGYCGYLWGKEIKEGELYTSHKAVLGVADDPNFIKDSFYDYIDAVRIRPLRLQVQYNSWFDFYSSVDQDKFAESVSEINQKLVEERGVKPLSAYVIDDGWQDVNADWSDKAWKVNHKFDSNFMSSTTNVQKANSKLGLWMSPGLLFGAQPAAQKYKAQGFETMGKWMSMAGPKYMQLLEDRIVELTKNGVSYFKLDGVFGHLNTREFELHGDRYGIPTMPQLGTDSIAPSDPILNDPKFDELKTYYLVAGTERLMQLFKKQHEVNPNVYVVISNGAYLSPWWLMYIDAVWMINAGDAAGGSNRTQELVYRDGVYYDTWQMENTQFPIHSVFNHEPKKVKTGESPEAFAEYLWMNLSRGTGFVEIYIKTKQLSSSDWDVLAEGLKWVNSAFPNFKRARMHGGNPTSAEVYGYTGWTKDSGYISFHNPSQEIKSYTVTLDRAFGLIPGKQDYTLSSPLGVSEEFNNKTLAYGSDLKISLGPGEVKVLDFK
ncbi:hypothetical protein MWU65_03900 [Cellulophaga sp. F20128]|uniref:hypothetical protein n=1 Tax=Cellulophaga sp. F20128 TaxID=2926413 RepID=UPI001FF1A211|nr:hypothetical protein [Cellulophaga sp. F20128]MCK0156308.1 hypothetical protein [Cellulophaga sp. F20128]